MKRRIIYINKIFKTLLFSVIILTITCWYHQLQAQENEILLFEENFNDLQVRDWELEDGWIITEGMLKGSGHSWARASVGPWQDFRLQFRLNLHQGRVHLVFRL